MKQILIADDHSIVRIGTSMLIKEVLGECEVSEATTFDSALDMVKRSSFDLLLLDINIPGGNNLDMINVLRLRDRQLRILVFSSYDESVYALRYIQAGAQGYLSKDSGEEEVKKAIRDVMDGKVYISEKIKQEQLQMINGGRPFNPLRSLSNRETEVMQLLVKGLGTKEIADVLSIRLNTVSTYKNRIFEKLEVSNLVELINKVQLYAEA